jgi:4,5-dihydroxyphthalate decarboxylase
MRLSLACGDYDRTRPLIDRTVKPLGIELTCLPMPVEEIFFRMARFRGPWARITGPTASRATRPR